MWYQKRDALGGNCLFPAHGVKFLPRFGLEPNLIDRQTERLGHAPADRQLVRHKLRSFRKDNTVDVADPPAGCRDRISCSDKHFERIAAAVCGIGIRKHLADVAQRRGAQEGVGQGVQEDVGIAMPDHFAIVGHSHPTDEQGPTGAQSMGVVSDPDPWSLRSRVSLPLSGRVSSSLFPNRPLASDEGIDKTQCREGSQRQLVCGLYPLAAGATTRAHTPPTGCPIGVIFFILSLA